VTGPARVLVASPGHPCAIAMRATFTLDDTAALTREAAVRRPRSSRLPFVPHLYEAQMTCRVDKESSVLLVSLRE
jgi:hypothetical protein